MRERKLGNCGLRVAEIGYGAMGTAVGYGSRDDAESTQAIRRAYELGVTMFDTAEMYGWGEGERLLGKAVAPFRGNVVIATKFGLTTSFAPNSQPDHIREVVEDSLRRLQVDTIDVLYQHVKDPAVPIEVVVSVMKEYVEAGKVKYLGLSNTDAESIRRAHAVHPISVLQAEYSIFDRTVEKLFPVLEELNIGLVAYSPLARGFLSGGVRPRDHYDASDFRQRIGWWAPENFAANVEIVNQLGELATGKGATLSQLSLAWLLAQKDCIVPIPGSRNPDRVTENVAAASLVLTDEDLARIRAIAPDGGIGGNYA